MEIFCSTWNIEGGDQDDSSHPQLRIVRLRCSTWNTHAGLAGISEPETRMWLVVKTNQENDSEDDGSEQYLGYVVVENSLIGLRRVMEIGVVAD